MQISFWWTSNRSFWRPSLTTDHLSRPKLSVTVIVEESVRLSARCQVLEWDCKRLVANVDARENDAGGMLDSLQLLGALAVKDRKVLCALFEDNSGRLKWKHAKAICTSKLRAIDGRLEAGDTARQEATHNLEAGDAL